MALRFPNQQQPASHDLRPERPDRVESRLEMVAHRMVGQLKRLQRSGPSLQRMVTTIDQLGEPLRSLDEAQLRQRIEPLRLALYEKGLTEQTVAESFALIRELAERILGMRHYPSQLTGGLIMLQGLVAEMETGEGKTLTATLPTATIALAGIPAHVISVNDYLTGRDADQMEPLYKALGLRVGRVIHGQSPAERRQAYLCDITYATNKELVFDYLRDRLTLAERLDPLLLQAEYLHGNAPRSQRVLMRGLHFALVDEADSILIDEARTPLIISGGEGGSEEREFLEQALELARTLEEDKDFVLDVARRQVLLTDQGKQTIEEQTQPLGPLWNGLVRRESTIYQALTALHFFHCDEQYLLRDGKVQIIDEFTGRVMADRSWEQGLHQMIELKEGCELSQRRETLAKISFQKFFRRYLHLSGMTGTAKEVTAELWAVYRLHTCRVPTHRPVIRQLWPDQVFTHEQDKWQAVVEQIRHQHQLGRPVLVGTRSVAVSEHLSKLVAQHGLAHQVLNAKQDATEAEIISRAGQAGAITIATNMAGRGTDIKLGPGVKKLGGLHVVATERHDAARIDRQLAGRCGRQGDPGSCQAFLCFEDPLLEGNRAGVVAHLVRRLATVVPVMRSSMARWAIRLAQNHVERYHARIRKELFRRDQAQGSLLSFSGRLE